MMDRAKVVDKIVQYEVDNDGWLMSRYKDSEDFKRDLMKEEDFSELLKYYENSRAMSNEKESSNYMVELIDLLYKYNNK